MWISKQGFERSELEEEKEIFKLIENDPPNIVRWKSRRYIITISGDVKYKRAYIDVYYRPTENIIINIFKPTFQQAIQWCYDWMNPREKVQNI